MAEDITQNYLCLLGLYYIEQWNLPENQSPLADSSVRVLIQKGLQEIRIFNPDGVVILMADAPTAMIFPKPEGYDIFQSDLMSSARDQATLSDTMRRLRNGDYTPNGGTTQNHIIYWTWVFPDAIRDPSERGNWNPP